MRESVKSVAQLHSLLCGLWGFCETGQASLRCYSLEVHRHAGEAAQQVRNGQHKEAKEEEQKR